MKRYSNYDKYILSENTTDITFEEPSVSAEFGTHSVNLPFMECTHQIIMISHPH